ncbi:MAG: DNA translocase FtsK [Lachnospiraceae bacterium]|nr:DNA translocase FtsK [Lachnospiraceae bacterium]
MAATQKKKRASRKRPQKRKEGFSVEVRDEVILWVGLAVTSLLFLCNFHLIGKAGDAVSGVMFGLFGLLAYLFPPFLFIGVLFIWVNLGRKTALIKEICGFMLFLVTEVLLSCITGLDKIGTTARENYAYAKEHIFSGGLVGGSIARALEKGIGVVGVIFLMLILLIICIVLMTEKSLISLITEGSRKLYDTAREDVAYRIDRNEELYEARQERAERRREIREEREKRRMDRKASGVTLDTDLTPDDKDKAATPAQEARPDKRDRIRQRILPEEADEMQELTLEEISQQIRITGLDNEIPEDDVVSDMEPLFPEEEVEKPKRRHKIEIREAREHEGSEDPDMMQISEALMQQADVLTAQESGVQEPGIGITPAGRSVIEAAGIATSHETTANAATTTNTALAASAEPAAPAKPKPRPKPYRIPPVSLLKAGAKKSGGSSEKELRETARMLESTLETFKVNARVTDISKGPAVTRYELQPEPGVKVSRIVSLTDDLKLALAATDIRIEAPIPGKSAVGIEVPNKENTMVTLRELIDSSQFKESESRLSFAVGKDIAGKVVATDIAKMPHVLIAGSTGSGKSVCINTLIMSILYKARPDEVKLIMVDPKVVELSVYNGIPHLLLPVVTDPKKAAAALQWGVSEMMDRYKKFEDQGVRDLKGYNAKMEQLNDNNGQSVEKLPQIVIIVDELADLMMVAAGEVEDSICRLAQLARAAGIHLVIATQRPSVDVITGLIKANMPSRIAFAVSSGVDSRTILDMVGAEKLLGKGDMLFYPQGYPKPVRIQGAFVSDKEVADVVDFLKQFTVEGAEEDDEVLSKLEQIQQGGGADGESREGDERDAYFADAGRFIIEKEKASIGMLQRVFKIGFNRAARIMDQLADYGVVGPEEGTKPRKILMSLSEFEQLLEEI